MRRFVLTLLAALAVLVAVGGAVVAGTDGGSAVTRARLERSLAPEAARLLADQAHLLGHPGVTAASLHPRAMCDKGGAVEADVGPGSNWNCLVSWTDPANPMPPEGYGKFELDVHTNGCWTAGGPSKLVGFATLTDTHGREVPNPVYEFDGCFDPGGDDTPTGVTFPSLLTVTSTTLQPDADGLVPVQLSCGTGSTGCHGALQATADGRDLGTVPVDLPEEQTATVLPPGAVPAGADAVDLTLVLASGTGAKGPTTTSSVDLEAP